MFKNDPNLQQGRQFLMYEEKTKDELLPSLGLIEETSSPHLTSIIEALEGKDSVKSNTNVDKTNLTNLEEQFNSTLVEYTTLYKTLSAELLTNKDINLAIDKVNNIKQPVTFPSCKQITENVIGMYCNDKLINEFQVLENNPNDRLIQNVKCNALSKDHGPCPQQEETKKPNIPFKIQQNDINKLNQLGDNLLKIIEEMMVELAALEVSDSVVNKEIAMTRKKLQNYKNNLKNTRDEMTGYSRNNMNFSGNREDANLRVNESHLKLHVWAMLLVTLIVIIFMNYSGYGTSNILNGIILIVALIALYYLANYLHKRFF